MARSTRFADQVRQALFFGKPEPEELTEFLLLSIFWKRIGIDEDALKHWSDLKIAKYLTIFDQFAKWEEAQQTIATQRAEAAARLRR